MTEELERACEEIQHIKAEMITREQNFQEEIREKTKHYEMEMGRCNREIEYLHDKCKELTQEVAQLNIANYTLTEEYARRQDRINRMGSPVVAHEEKASAISMAMSMLDESRMVTARIRPHDAPTISAVRKPGL